MLIDCLLAPQASFASIMSSKLSIEDLQKLMMITAKSEDGESTVILKVDGFARFPGETHSSLSLISSTDSQDITTQDGTTAELYTAGKHRVIALDAGGTLMHLDED
eukprot:1475501-Rhodomonas_salina.1